MRIQRREINNLELEQSTKSKSGRQGQGLGPQEQAQKGTHPWVLVLLKPWLPLCVCRALVPPWLLIRPLVAALMVWGPWGRVPTSVRGIARVGVPCLSVSPLHTMVTLVLRSLVPLIACGGRKAVR